MVRNTTTTIDGVVGSWAITVRFTDGPLQGRIDHDTLEFLNNGLLVYLDGRGVGSYALHGDRLEYRFYYVVEADERPSNLVAVTVDAMLTGKNAYRGSGRGVLYGVNATGVVEQLVEIAAIRR